MLNLKTIVNVKGISGRNISDFMLSCTDKDYQDWWPGTHFAFHTIKRFPNDLGNLVYFDEYVGKRRLKFEGVVITNDPGKEIAWQMKKVIKIPAWLALEFEDNDQGVKITHTMKAGFSGIGKVFDPLLRLYFTADFEKELEEHAHFEFTKLAEILS